MNTSTLESFISYCDDMMIAEEGFKDVIKKVFGKKDNESANNSVVVQGIHVMYQNGVEISPSVEDFQNKMISFVIKNKQKIVNTISAAASKELSDFPEDIVELKKSTPDWLYIHKLKNGKLDASIGLSFGQWNLVNINSMGITQKNVKYFD